MESATNGIVVIQSVEPLKLTLAGVNLTCTNGPAISIQSSNRCFVSLPQGAANALADSSTYTMAGDGTLHGTGPLIFSDPGWLTFPNRVYRAVGAE